MSNDYDDGYNQGLLDGKESRDSEVDDLKRQRSGEGWEMIKPICPKCGSSDILTQWHPASKAQFPNEECADTCGQHRSILNYGKYPIAKEEHLHRGCRNCQFEWIDPTKDIKKRATGGGK